VTAKRRKRKQPSDEISSIAGRILAGGGYTPIEVRKLAAAVLSLDVVAGPNKGEHDDPPDGGKTKEST
jgi:hypothetical protein